MYVECLTCHGDITARVQIGSEQVQPVVIACPHCQTELRFDLQLQDPPNVGVQWIENCTGGTKEGKIINVGAGFAINKERVHDDMYFPSFELFNRLAKSQVLGRMVRSVEQQKADANLEFGEQLGLTDIARTVRKAWQLHRANRADLRDRQMEEFRRISSAPATSIHDVLAAFNLILLSPKEDVALSPLEARLDDAYNKNGSELIRLAIEWREKHIVDRLDNYLDLIKEYIRGFGDFSQTLIYAKLRENPGEDRLASSTDFDSTKMFYGNAFELLGSHLDFVAALNNILQGRQFDRLEKLSLAQYRALNKASRTTCFESDAALRMLTEEYDSTIRNASHHRWFKLDQSRKNISFRWGGTGAERVMTYADYLYRCNRMLLQIAALVNLELILLKRARQSL